MDERGIRRVLSASLLLVAAGIALCAVARTPLQLGLAYGVIASLGFGGASGVAASVAVTHWFTLRRGLAFALVEAGFGAGQLLLVPAALALVAALGWRDALWAAAGLALVTAPLMAAFLRDRPADVGVEPIGGAPVAEPAHDGPPAVLGFRELLRAPAFWGLAAPFFVCGITTTGFVDTHLIALAQDRGIGTGTTGLAVAVLAAANVTGILVSGPLADRIDNRLFLGVLYGTRALSFVALGLLVDAQALVAFALLFGLVDFAVVAPTQWLAARYVEPRTVGLAFGCLNAVHQLGSAVGAWLPGVVFDATGSYDAVIAGAVAALTLATLVCLTLPRARPLPVAVASA